MGDVVGRKDKILHALKSFDFSDYGCDEVDQIMADRTLDLGPHLAEHIDKALK